MAITINQDIITFSGMSPKLEHTLIGKLEADSKLIFAAWYTNRLPMANNKLAYMYYEGVNHFSKSEYLYFPIPGGAAMVLKPHIRARYQIRDVRDYLTQIIYNTDGN